MVGEYALLLALAGLGGAGVPGPGDSGLIAAALLAAEGYLNLAAVLIVAYVGCLVGRMVGYQLGVRNGRALMERTGFAHGARSRMLAKGDQLFRRFPRVAALFAPAPIAGIYRVRAPVFFMASLLITLNWTLMTGLIAYFLGEAALKVIGRAGIKGALVIVALVGVGLTCRYLWQRRGPREAS